MLNNQSSNSVSIDSGDIIRLVLQFLKENDLNNSFEALQNETRVNLNIVPDSEIFVNDIKHGRWDKVLANISTLKLPMNKLINLYEHIVLELLELKEIDLVRTLLKQSKPLIVMRNTQFERYQRLEKFLGRSYLESKELYPVGNREKRRQVLASELIREVVVVDSSRLLTLLSQALKFQSQVGLLDFGKDGNNSGGISNMMQYDLFRGCIPTREEEEEIFPRSSFRTMRFESVALPEIVRFSPDGTMMVVGLTNGFIEIYDPQTAQLRLDLPYQGQDEFMSHKGMILALNFSRRGDFLVSAGQYGIVKIWKLATGDCLKMFEGLHADPITSAGLSRDDNLVLTTSFDNTIKVHGVKSGKTLKVFSGHTNVVNAAYWTKDNRHIISASADGFIGLWDAETTDCISKVRIQNSSPNLEIAIHTMIPLPGNTDNFILASKSDQIFIINKEGKPLRRFQTPKATSDSPGPDVLAMTISPKANWVYIVAEGGILHCFNLITGELEHSLNAHTSEVIGLAHHPSWNILASYTTIGELKLWKP